MDRPRIDAGYSSGPGQLRIEFEFQLRARQVEPNKMQQNWRPGRLPRQKGLHVEQAVLLQKRNRRQANSGPQRLLRLETAV